VTGRRIDEDSQSGLAIGMKYLEAGLDGLKSEKIVANARKFDRYYRGIHAISQRNVLLGNKPYNRLAEGIDQLLARMTNTHIKFYFHPQEDLDSFSAQALNEIIGDVVWDYIKWDDKSEDSILEAFAVGSSHIRGEVDDNFYPNFSVWPAGSTIPDPDAKSKEDCNFIIWVSESTPRTVKENYGIKLSAGAGVDYESDPNEVMKSWEDAGRSKAPVFSELETDSRRSPHFPKVIVYEIWMEDERMVPIAFDQTEIDDEHAAIAQLKGADVFDQQNHPRHIKEHRLFIETLDQETDTDLIAEIEAHIEAHNQFPPDLKRRKYPYGRIITIAEGKLLRDEPFPEERHWRNMYVKWDWLKQRNKYWGKPGATDAYPIQDDINFRKNAITQNINLLLNGVRKIGPSLHKKLSQFTNLIGLNVPVQRPDDFTVDMGKPLPSTHHIDLAHSEQSLDRILKRTDVLSGNLPAAGTANVTIETLIEQASVAGSTPLKHYSQALKEMARIAIYLMQRYMPQATVFDIINNEEKTGNVSWAGFADNAGLKDIRISVKAFRFSREKDFQFALQMYQAGLYDRQAVYDTIDDPNKYAIAKRMDEIDRLSQIVEIQNEKIEDLTKAINTQANRTQGQDGAGNTAIA